MEIRLTLIFSTFLLSIYAFAQPWICEDPNIGQLVADGSPGFSQKLFKETVSSAKILIAGEVHFYTDLKPRLDLINNYNMHQAGKKCVAFEFAFRNHGFEETLGKIKARITAMKSIEFITAHPELKKEDLDAAIAAYQPIIDYYQPMSDSAIALGIKSKQVDHKDHWDVPNQSMDERNKAMAENLKALIDSGDCDSVLFFVGKAHLAINADSTTRVQDLLRIKNITTTTINLQMTTETLPYGARSWSLCPFSSKKLSDYSFIKNDKLSGDPLLFPFMNKTGVRWKDFDFTLLTPN